MAFPSAALLLFALIAQSVARQQVEVPDNSILHENLLKEKCDLEQYLDKIKTNVQEMEKELLTVKNECAVDLKNLKHDAANNKTLLDKRFNDRIDEIDQMHEASAVGLEEEIERWEEIEKKMKIFVHKAGRAPLMQDINLNFTILLNTVADYGEADGKCRALGMRLADFTNSKANKELSEALLSDRSGKYYFWLSGDLSATPQLYEAGTQPMSFVNRSNAQPDDEESQQNCVHFKRSTVVDFQVSKLKCKIICQSDAGNHGTK